MVESKAGVDRELLFYGVLSLLALYLVIGHFNALVCTLTAFAYPAYASSGFFFLLPPVCSQLV